MLNGVGPVKSTICNKGYRPLESGEGICADAEERVCIPAGTQVRVLGIYLRGEALTSFPNRHIGPLLYYGLVRGADDLSGVYKFLDPVSAPARYARDGK